MARSNKATPKSPPSDPAPTTPSANKPVHTIRYRAIKVAIWKNEGPTGAFYSATPTRSYQDDQQKWHDTTSFHAADLPTLAKALLDAHSWIAWQQRRSQEARSTTQGGGG